MGASFSPKMGRASYGMLYAQVHQLMWYTILVYRYVNPPDSIAFPSLHVQESTTPLLRAAQKGHAEIAHFLLRNGSDVQEENNVSRLERMMFACMWLVCYDKCHLLEHAFLCLDSSVQQKCGLAG